MLRGRVHPRIALPLAIAIGFVGNQGCGRASDGDVAKTCELFVAEGQALRDSMTSNGQAPNLLALATAPAQLADLFSRLADTAPAEVAEDFETLAEGFEKAAAQGGDLKAAIVEGFVVSAQMEPAFQRVNTWIGENCEPPSSPVGTVGEQFPPAHAVDLYRLSDQGCTGEFSWGPSSDAGIGYVEYRWNNALRSIDYYVDIDGREHEHGSMKGPDIDGQGGLVQLKVLVDPGELLTIGWRPVGDNGLGDTLLGDCQMTVSLWGTAR